MIRIFIGHTEGADVLLNVLQQSIRRHSSQPISVTPLVLAQLRSIHTRPRHALQSTDFSFTRFLVPYLSGYQGWALYLDNDMLVRADIAALWGLRDDSHALLCVQHDAAPQTATKFLGHVQAPYARKNWSSLMLFNCAACQALTPAYVDSASGLDLHQFKWLGEGPGAGTVGALPKAWNHLVGVDPPYADAKNVHFTLGGPYYPGHQAVEHADAWRAEREQTLACATADAR